MKLAKREMNLAWMTGVVALSAITFAICEPRVKEWKDVRRQQRVAGERLDHTKLVISNGPKYKGELEELRKKLPQHPSGRDVTALTMIEEAAQTNGVRLLTRSSEKAEKAKKSGEFYEQAIICTYDSSLPALVYFLFNLEQQGAMIYIRELKINSGSGGGLNGSFKLNYVYEKNGQ